MKKIIIVDKVDPLLVKNLTEYNCECEINTTLSQSSFINLPNEYYGLIIRSAFKIDETVISSKSRLKFIIRIGSGMESIDVKTAEKHGIKCISTPEGNAQAVAEHCLAFLLASLRNIIIADKEVKSGLWNRTNKGCELSDLTVGIIGFGHNGRAFAKTLNLLGCNVLAYDKYHPNFTEDGVTECSIEEILERANVISLHVNYIPENYHFINEEMIEKMANSPILINSSRGAVVDTKALLHGLNIGKLTHAALDVLEYENVKLKIPARSEWDETLVALAQCDKATLTPHVAGQTLGSHRKHAEIAFQKLIAAGLIGE